MRARKLLSIGILVLAVTLAIMPVVDAASAATKRQAVRDMADETLQRLYALHPSAQSAVENSAGYAVFSNVGIKVLFIGSGHGRGIAINRHTGQEYFMKMGELGAGFGLGVKNFSVIFVFDTEKDYNRFIKQGWKFGGQATLAATDGVSGGSMEGAVSIWPGAWMYQLTDKGLAVELMVNGTRYFRDDELN